MPQSRRLADLEKTLELLIEKLGSMEQNLAMASDAEVKISIKQRIREEIKPDIDKFQTEYWDTLAREVNSLKINETEADAAVIEVIQVIESFEQNNADMYAEQGIALLLDIRNKLSEPGPSATAKLKAAIPLFPPFVSYEVEFEPASFLRRVFPTFSRLVRKAEKK